MSKPTIVHDLTLVMNGLLKVASSSAAIRKAQVDTILTNSSLRNAAQTAPETLKKVLPTDIQDVVQRASMIPVGIQQFAMIAPKYIIPGMKNKKSPIFTSPSGHTTDAGDEEEILTIRAEDLEGIYIQSLGVELMQQNADGRKYAETVKEDSYNRKQEDIRPFDSKADSANYPFAPSLDEKSTPVVNHSQSTASISTNENNVTVNKQFIKNNTLPPPPGFEEPIKLARLNVKPLSKNKPTSQLGATSKQRKVPATRISRLVSYGGLAAGLGIGAITEITKRSLGLTNPNSGTSILDSSPFLTEANAERIVDTLCRVRGAALKIGQILSIQDNSMINPQLQKVFERVRHAADFMPDWQMERMMASELGPDWKDKVAEFDLKPFAAASIGQVHLGKLHDDRTVAIKIQYPGVGQGISSDIDNLVSVLNVWNIIPEGVFIDSIIDVAKRELSWEVDYEREAKCAKKFKKLLDPYPEYYVPEVIDDLTTNQVYTTELIEGIAVDKCASLDQETRDRISFLMLDLFFKELFEFQFMQTDPNWANFLYNAETRQIGLLDFGASREYKNSFVDNYMKILVGAAEADRKTVIEYSRKIGFLSGYESKAMENAHTDTVMLLGEALRMGDGPYDFGNQNLTLRIQKLVPVMVKERLCPPPEEVYSLHRKLSGIFLLCSKLKGKVKCRQIFDRVKANYEFNRPDTDAQKTLTVDFT